MCHFACCGGCDVFELPGNAGIVDAAAAGVAAGGFTGKNVTAAMAPCVEFTSPTVAEA